jgi:hypothetical protein
MADSRVPASTCRLSSRYPEPDDPEPDDPDGNDDPDGTAESGVPVTSRTGIRPTSGRDR